MEENKNKIKKTYRDLQAEYGSGSCASYIEFWFHAAERKPEDALADLELWLSSEEKNCAGITFGELNRNHIIEGFDIDKEYILKCGNELLENCESSEDALKYALYCHIVSWSLLEINSYDVSPFDYDKGHRAKLSLKILDNLKNNEQKEKVFSLICNQSREVFCDHQKVARGTPFYAEDHSALLYITAKQKETGELDFNFPEFMGQFNSSEFMEVHMVNPMKRALLITEEDSLEQ